ncbi:hypothetical protein [Paucisalibacillus globulus]|uniref:hypothetical protein n=1 Tax=Paucisalibacillus globulus TaxID=351095 RepID=UPI0012EB0A8C|nr:hypothetical protein [Paucisalibacillus globulus]
MVQQIIEDPFSVVEGIGQSFSDSVEEDGIVYVTGNFAAGFVPVVGWSRYAKLAKVGDLESTKTGINKTNNNKVVDDDTEKLTKELKKLQTPKEKEEFLLQKSKTLDVSTEKNQAIFYAGRIQAFDSKIGDMKTTSARELAERYADSLLKEKAITKLTLERTPGGKWMDDLKLYEILPNEQRRFEVEYGLTWEQADEIWSVLSSRFADNASGAITAFAKNVPEKIKPRTIFWSTELPRLRKNPNVTHINIR